MAFGAHNFGSTRIREICGVNGGMNDGTKYSSGQVATTYHKTRAIRIGQSASAAPTVGGIEGFAETNHVNLNGHWHQSFAARKKPPGLQR